MSASWDPRFGSMLTTDTGGTHSNGQVFSVSLHSRWGLTFRFATVDMSELQYYLRPRPAYEPVRTEGDVFWRDGDRVRCAGNDLAR